MAKADYTVRWSKVAQEYVARSTRNPDVTGHSRDPNYALMALLAKVRELEGKALAAKKRQPASWCCYKGQLSRLREPPELSAPKPGPLVTDR